MKEKQEGLITATTLATVQRFNEAFNRQDIEATILVFFSLSTIISSSTLANRDLCSQGKKPGLSIRSL